MHMHYLYFFSGFDSYHHCYVCTCSAPLPIRQAITLEPEVVGRSVLARWIGLCLEWFGCQENENVRTFGWKSWVPNRGAAGEHVIFVPVHLNNLTSRSRTVAIPCTIEEA